MPAQPNQSLIHGIACLQAVAASERPVGSREVARQLGYEHTRVSRLLSTLADIGLLERTTQRKYQPGAGLHVLAAQSLHGSMLLAASLPHLKGLMGRGMTVALGVLWRRHVCFLFHAKPGQPLEESIGRHQLHPAERSSAGLALLAYALPAAESVPDRGEPADPIAADALDGVLAGVRERGYARLRFHERRVLSVGLPLGSPPLAALAVSGPWGEDEAGAAAELLRECAGKILVELAAAHGG